MSELEREPADDPIVAAIASLAVSVAEMSRRELAIERRFRELEDQLGELGARISAEGELRARADESARNEIEDLGRRLTNVHSEAIRALTKRAERSTSA